jgi:hypothetical protein
MPRGTMVHRDSPLCNCCGVALICNLKKAARYGTTCPSQSELKRPLAVALAAMLILR